MISRRDRAAKRCSYSKHTEIEIAAFFLGVQGLAFNVDEMVQQMTTTIEEAA